MSVWLALRTTLVGWWTVIGARTVPPLVRVNTSVWSPAEALLGMLKVIVTLPLLGAALPSVELSSHLAVTLPLPRVQFAPVAVTAAPGYRSELFSEMVGAVPEITLK